MARTPDGSLALFVHGQAARTRSPQQNAGNRLPFASRRVKQRQCVRRKLRFRRVGDEPLSKIEEDRIARNDADAQAYIVEKAGHTGGFNEVHQGWVAFG
jgi:hypothetical protein